MKGNRRRKDLQEKTKQYLLTTLKLSPRDIAKLDNISLALSNIAHDHYCIRQADRERTMRILSERWFKSLHDVQQKNFRGGRKRHSYYSFAKQIDQQYYVIALTKESFASKWLFKLISSIFTIDP